MPNSQRIIYWDACCFLSYINEIADRMPVLDALLEESANENGGIRLYTSSLSKVEVAFSASEQMRRVLDDETEQRIENLWADPNVLVTVEFHDGIERTARNLMRSGITTGWSLKPLDAIHLATAQWLSEVGLKVDQFHTYDESLFKWTPLVDFTIIEPNTPQLHLL